MYRRLVVLVVILSAFAAPTAAAGTGACVGECAVEGPGLTIGEPPALGAESTTTGAEQARTVADDGAPVGAVAALALGAVALALAVRRRIQKFR